MWAVSERDEKVRHYFGRGDLPIAICGEIGTGDLDYYQVKMPRCKKCEEIVFRGGRRDSHNGLGEHVEEDR